MHKRAMHKRAMHKKAMHKKDGHKILPVAIFTSAFLLCLIGVLPSAYADNKAISQYVPNAERIGEGRLSYFFWDIYDATLYSAAIPFADDRPFALKINYLRSIKGSAIAESSAEEIKKQGFDEEQKLSLWLDKMMNIFPDVMAGDSITGIRDKNGYAIFYMNDQPIGTVEDTEFAEKFFAIWLGGKTTEPGLRKKLLGAIKP